MLVQATLSRLIEENMRGLGAKGERLKDFTDSIAQGVVEHLTGLAFVTADVGAGTGGSGSGKGIKGLDSAKMVSVALSKMPSTGEKAEVTFKAIMDGVVEHLKDTKLKSSSLVGVGAAVMKVGSIQIKVGGLTDAIVVAFNERDADGENLPVFCSAVAEGIVASVGATGTGILAISGGGTLPPVSGGAGKGTLS